MGYFSTFFLVLLLLLVTELGPAAKKIYCDRLSRDFEGWCFRSASCANVCKGEGGTDGKCGGFQCVCTHVCADGL
ncbi:hypothetical protein ACJIZ3_013654 [Penstemon smallii]|uniref:Knottins-like domain-containing protein n=1 Tax=Penstemon smallii TaxID=265156 RepID=A0ABD3RKU0_9LAMI